MIDTKLLRQKILDLAIRGKLVPQNPEDEPASVLLEKIRQEKAALVKAGKIKKDKHESFIFRGDDKHYYEQIDGKTVDITEEIPFDLPNSWSWCRLRNLGEIVGGGTPSTDNTAYWDNGDVAWLSPADLTSYTNKYISRGKKSITQSGLLNSSAKLMPKGSVLYSSRAPIGYVVISAGEISTNQGFKSIVPVTTESNEFLYYYLKAVTSEIKSRATGTTFKEISGNEFGATLVPLPPLPEQQRIVFQIEALFSEVDKIEKDSADLESALALAKQKVLDLAIRGKLVPQDPNDEPASELLKRIKTEKDALIKARKIKRDKHESYIFKGDDNRYFENIDGETSDISEEIPFDIPESWEWCRLSTFSEFDLGKTLDRQKNTGNYRKYLRNVNVLWGNIELSDIKEMRFEDTELERYSIKRGDLLICEGGDVGRCAVWDKNFVFYYQNALHRVRFYQKCNPWFYQFVMMFFENTGLLKEISQGVTIKHLTKNTLNGMFFPLPPLAEQKRIVSQIERFFAELETMQK